MRAQGPIVLRQVGRQRVEQRPRLGRGARAQQRQREIQFQPVVAGGVLGRVAQADDFLVRVGRFGGPGVGRFLLDGAFGVIP